MFGKQRGGDFKLPARRVEAGLAIRTEQPLLPFLVLHHGRGNPRFTAGRAYLFQSETGPLQSKAQ